MFNNFAKAVKAHFDFLVSERGYEIIEEHIADIFDNGCVTYSSPRIWVEVTRDRGFVSLDVRPAVGPDSCDGDILRHLVAGADYSPPIEPYSAVRYAEFLRAQLATVEELFSPDNLHGTMQRVRELMRQRAELS